MGFRLTDYSRNLENSVSGLSKGASSIEGASLRVAWPAKRVFDVLVTVTGLIFVGPLMLLTALLIWLQDGGSPIYSQWRIGRGGKPFKCYKLRSMVTDSAERLAFILATDPAARREWEATQKLTNDPRITRLGHFIRKTSIDELPQLLNVLFGEMSLVGPRPIVQGEVARYGDQFEHYASVTPGITGLWQVRGRSNTSYQQRVALDTTYALTRSFWGDVAILIMTIPVVLASRGAR